MKWSILLIVLFIVGLFGGIFLSQGKKVNQQNNVTPTAFSEPTPIVSGQANTTFTVTPGDPNEKQQVKIFLVALEDNGKSGKLIGCGDSLIPVTQEVPKTQTPLRAALEQLLSLKEQYFGQSGLYNALYQSNLSIESVVIANGNAIVRLRGTHALGGVCDTPRFIGQIEETARQFSTVKDVEIFLNGTVIDEALSEK